MNILYHYISVLTRDFFKFMRMCTAFNSNLNMQLLRWEMSKSVKKSQDWAIFIK